MNGILGVTIRLCGSVQCCVIIHSKIHLIKISIYNRDIEFLILEP